MGFKSKIMVVHGVATISKKILVVWLMVVSNWLAVAQNVKVTRIDSLPFNTEVVNALAVDAKEQLWVGTNKGLVKVLFQNDEETKIEGYAAQNKPIDKINSITIDWKDNKWLGTYTSEVLYVSSTGDEKTISLMPLTQRKKQLVTSIFLGKNKSWFATSEGGVYCYDQSTKILSEEVKPIENNIYSLYVHNDGTKVICTTNGLLKSNEANDKWEPIGKLKQAQKIMWHKDAFWVIGKQQNGLPVLLQSADLKKWVLHELTCAVEQNIRKFNDFLFDEQGDIWLATENGLIRYTVKSKVCQLINSTNYPNFTAKSIDCVALQGHNLIWAGSNEAGLYCIELTDLVPQNKDHTDAVQYALPDQRTDILKQLSDLECGKIVLIPNLTFKIDQMAFIDDSKANSDLDMITLFLKTNPSLSIELHGHTDIYGKLQKMESLSQIRVKEVQRLLIEKGVEKKRIKSYAWGTRYPVTNNPSEGHKNRRVEVKVLCID